MAVTLPQFSHSADRTRGPAPGSTSRLSPSRFRWATFWCSRDRAGMVGARTAPAGSCDSRACCRPGRSCRRCRAQHLRYGARLHPSLAESGGRDLGPFPSVLVFGCYVGEVLVRNAGYEWVDSSPEVARWDGQFTVYRTADKAHASPIWKAFKRVNNGEIDAVSDREVWWVSRAFETTALLNHSDRCHRFCLQLHIPHDRGTYAQHVQARS